MSKLPSRFRSGTEIAPGIWSDPLSERRHDYDGAQAAYEAALAHTLSIVSAIGGGNAQTEQSLDMIWDAALEVAAQIVLRELRINYDIQLEVCSAIRDQKKQR